MRSADERRARLREICHALPEVSSDEDQHIRFHVRGRTFAYYLEDHHGDGRLALHCKAPRGEQAALVASDPERFHVPAYLGQKGWIGYWLDVGAVDWSEVRELVLESYRLIAPRSLGALVDRPPG